MLTNYRFMAAQRALYWMLFQSTMEFSWLSMHVSHSIIVCLPHGEIHLINLTSFTFLYNTDDLPQRLSSILLFRVLIGVSTPTLQSTGVTKKGAGMSWLSTGT